MVFGSSRLEAVVGAFQSQAKEKQEAERTFSKDTDMLLHPLPVCLGTLLLTATEKFAWSY